MTEVWDSASVKGSARLVLLALADHANDEGYCFPSLARLARKALLSERNVQLILRVLEKRGELVLELGRGRGHLNRYWVLPPATVRRLTSEGKNPQNFHPLFVREEKVKNAVQKVQNPAQKVKPVSPEPNNQQQPSKNQHSRPTKQAKVEFSDQTELATAFPEGSSAASATPGSANGGQKSSAPGPGRRAWASWLEHHEVPDWLELSAWASWLEDLDQRGLHLTSGRIEAQLRALHDLAQSGELQERIVARSIAGGWASFYPARSSSHAPAAARGKTPQDERYARYR